MQHDGASLKIEELQSPSIILVSSTNLQPEISFIMMGYINFLSFFLLISSVNALLKGRAGIWTQKVAHGNRGVSFANLPINTVSQLTFRVKVLSDSTADGRGDNENTGKVISCETTGSCGATRRAYKQELNEQRDKKRRENAPIEDNYLDMISGNKSAAKASYSPFKKQIPPPVQQQS